MNAVGYFGEKFAIHYFQTKGYTILKKNYLSPVGEVDIIAIREKKLIFCEVKTWIRYPKSMLEHVIDYRKRRHIVGAAKRFLYKEGIYSMNKNYQIRFDLLFISLTPKFFLQHMRNVFS